MATEEPKMKENSWGLANFLSAENISLITTSA
jgi:hypothetical protein